MSNVENKEESTRYNEKRIIKEFLNSPNGIQFLLEKVRNYNTTQNLVYDTDTNDGKKYDIVKCTDEIIDYYTAWIDKCPSKVIYHKSHYEGFKNVEKICEEKEVKELFNYLFE
ncbi:hypothetical protein COBT_000379 [Conglomerata obtusa]